MTLMKLLQKRVVNWHKGKYTYIHTHIYYILARNKPYKKKNFFSSNIKDGILLEMMTVLTCFHQKILNHLFPIRKVMNERNSFIS